VLRGLAPGQATVITLTGTYHHELLDFLTRLHPQGVSAAHLDISRKRNLGLIISRLCGWRRVLFLDDDIYGLGTAHVALASTTLDKYSVAGFKEGYRKLNSKK
jgi:hypothetical protein